MVVTVRIPQALPLQPVPERDHDRELLGFDPGTRVMVATSAAVTPGCTLAGALSSNEKLLVIWTFAELCLEGSAALVAVSVTLAFPGKICGAVKFPFASTLPQDAVHDGPERLQRIAGSGLPLLEIEAWKGCAAPSSTLAVPGEIETVMSLERVTLTVANFEELAWLVAVTCTVPPWGRSAGAVYTPSAEIVPA